MVFGKIVHTAIERRELRNRELGKLVGWSLHEWDREMASSQFLGGKAPRPPKSFKRMYENYINKIKPQLKNEDVSIEYFFKQLLSYTPDDTPIYFVGKIDRTDINGIYDWKTSERLPDSYELASNQFFAYWWAFRREFDTDPKGIYYGHLGSGNLYNIDMSSVLLNNFEALLNKMSSEISNAWKNNEFPRIIGYQCKQCPFRSICFRELQEEEGDV
jgi:CRISPR/Cas system-associated exonuclease Cas4 (RecB family)